MTEGVGWGGGGRFRCGFARQSAENPRGQLRTPVAGSRAWRDSGGRGVATPATPWPPENFTAHRGTPVALPAFNPLPLKSAKTQ